MSEAGVQCGAQSSGAAKNYTLLGGEERQGVDASAIPEHIAQGDVDVREG